MLEFNFMDESELLECADLAARAFQSYTYFKNYIPDENRRKRFLKKLLRTEFKANAHLKNVRFIVAKEDGKIKAVAHICLPGFTRPSVRDYIKHGILKAVLAGGISDVIAWSRMEEKATQPCHNLDTWYLSLLTVDPEFQGDGVGTSFLQDGIIPVIKDHGGHELCLFTNSMENRLFYKKNGFECFAEQYYTYMCKLLGSWSYIKYFN